MIIACIGPSGSGKTTITRNIRKWDYLNGRKVNIKEEDNFITLKFLKLIFGDKLFAQYKNQKYFNQKAFSYLSTIFSWAVYWFYPLIIYLEFITTHFIYTAVSGWARPI